MKLWIALFAALLTAACAGTPKQAEREIGDAQIDVIYVATPPAVVDAMLALAEVGPGDVLYDLGSGDGRINIEAARQFGVRGVGIELDPRLIAEANRKAREAGVSHLVRFRRQDLFNADFSEASVVTLYLLPELNDELLPILLKQLKPGSRIVSHAFGMTDWPPEQEVQVGDSVIYRWTAPERP